MKKKIANWGNYPHVEAAVYQNKLSEEIYDSVKSCPSIIARGNGRCYGDSSLNKNIFSTLPLNKVIKFDKQTGVFECEAGRLLSDILAIIIPKGFFLAVTPGTKFITIGGAIAADVHGKNHHLQGSFSKHLIAFDLLIDTGEIITCTPFSNEKLFWQTCGGMGLTGIILKATIQLQKIETTYIHQKTLKANHLFQLMDLMEENENYTYSVAWIDGLAKGKNLGKSLLMLGEHLLLGDLPKGLKVNALHRQSRFKIPFYFPSFLLNQWTIKVYNFLHFYKNSKQESNQIKYYDSFFYPLDSLGGWNKMYGKKGFTQYQLVLPLEKSRQGLVEILQTIHESGESSFLSVLKLFGEADERAVMSFPTRGYTLSLDFKISNKVFLLLSKLDEIVLRSDGRLYLAKDARMSASFFEKTYPKKVNRNPFFESLQSKRLNL